jgi:hypothetical protein
MVQDQNHLKMLESTTIYLQFNQVHKVFKIYLLNSLIITLCVDKFGKLITGYL